MTESAGAGPLEQVLLQAVELDQGQVLAAVVVVQEQEVTEPVAEAVEGERVLAEVLVLGRAPEPGLVLVQVVVAAVAEAEAEQAVQELVLEPVQGQELAEHSVY